MSINLWTEVSSEPISEKAIRALYPASKGYRHFPNAYAAGVRFGGDHSRESRVFVLEGACTYCIGDSKVTIRAGEFAELVPGAYQFEASPTHPVRLVTVYGLSELSA